MLTPNEDDDLTAGQASDLIAAMLTPYFDLDLNASFRVWLVYDLPSRERWREVAAAKAVLEMAVRAIEMEDLEAHITDLEQKLAASKNGGSSHGR
jgi:hypothetical protein